MSDQWEPPDNLWALRQCQGVCDERGRQRNGAEGSVGSPSNPWIGSGGSVGTAPGFTGPLSLRAPPPTEELPSRGPPTPSAGSHPLSLYFLLFKPLGGNKAVFLLPIRHHHRSLNPWEKMHVYIPLRSLQPVLLQIE